MAEHSFIDLTVAWRVYAEVWPLLDVLASMGPVDREALHVGLSPMDEQAVAFVESGSQSLLTEDLPPVEIPENMGGGQVAVAALTIPKRVHVLPYSALQGAEDTEGREVLGILRRAYHHSPGNVRPGTRLLDLLLLASRDDFVRLYEQAKADAVKTTRAVSQSEGVRQMEDAIAQASSYIAELAKAEQAARIRAYWQRRRGS